MVRLFPVKIQCFPVGKNAVTMWTPAICNQIKKKRLFSKYLCTMTWLLLNDCVLCGKENKTMEIVKRSKGLINWKYLASLAVNHTHTFLEHELNAFWHKFTERFSCLVYVSTHLPKKYHKWYKYIYVHSHASINFGETNKQKKSASVKIRWNKINERKSTSKHIRKRFNKEKKTFKKAYKKAFSCQEATSL